MRITPSRKGRQHAIRGREGMKVSARVLIQGLVHLHVFASMHSRPLDTAPRVQVQTPPLLLIAARISRREFALQRRTYQLFSHFFGYRREVGYGSYWACSRELARVTVSSNGLAHGPLKSCDVESTYRSTFVYPGRG